MKHLKSPLTLSLACVTLLVGLATFSRIRQPEFNHNVTSLYGISFIHTNSGRVHGVWVGDYCIQHGSTLENL